MYGGGGYYVHTRGDTLGNARWGTIHGILQYTILNISSVINLQTACTVHVLVVQSVQTANVFVTSRSFTSSLRVMFLPVLPPTVPQTSFLREWVSTRLSPSLKCSDSMHLDGTRELYQRSSRYFLKPQSWRWSLNLCHSISWSAKVSSKTKIKFTPLLLRNYHE